MSIIVTWRQWRRRTETENRDTARALCIRADRICAIRRSGRHLTWVPIIKINGPHAKSRSAGASREIFTERDCLPRQRSYDMKPMFPLYLYSTTKEACREFCPVAFHRIIRAR